MIQNTEEKKILRGRAVKNKKRTTENTISLDILKLKEWGYFQDENAAGEIKRTYDGQETMTFKYRRHLQNRYHGHHYENCQITCSRPPDTKDGQRLEQTSNISIIYTNCNYGNRRPWFSCPSRGKDKACGRRVRILYLIADYTFACRKCCRLTYRSCQTRANCYYRGSSPPIDRLLEIEGKLAKTRSPKKLAKLNKQMQIVGARIERHVLGFSRTIHRKFGKLEDLDKELNFLREKENIT